MQVLESSQINFYKPQDEEKGWKKVTSVNFFHVARSYFLDRLVRLAGRFAESSFLDPKSFHACDMQRVGANDPMIDKFTMCESNGTDALNVDV